MNRYTTLILIISFVSIISQSCATIVNGSRQEVDIYSYPPEARVSIDGKDYGNTPVNTKLVRRYNHYVRIEKSGYEPLTIDIKRKFSAWILGSIMPVPLIAIPIDLVTGSYFKLIPSEIEAELSSINAHPVSEKILQLFITIKPDPECKKTDND